MPGEGGVADSRLRAGVGIGSQLVFGFGIGVKFRVRCGGDGSWRVEGMEVGGWGSCLVSL